MRNLIIPAILVRSEQEFRERLRVVDGLVDIVQIDVMDGHFVPNTTWCDLEAIRKMDSPMKYELHLMVSDPLRYIEDAVGIIGMCRMVWHIEASVNHEALIQRCHELGFEAGLAISPKTPIERLAAYAHHIDQILVMGVEPGWSAQELIAATIEKAARIRMTWSHVPLAFDGGVGAASIPALKAAGVTRFCAASSIFKAEYPRVSLGMLERL